MIERTEDGQVTWSDLGLWSGKTCQELSAATKEKTSRQSSKRSSASQNRKPPILKCLKKAGQLGGDTTMKWEDDGAWLGECMTRNTGESPNAAVVSRLSQILEETPQEKYSLSAKACQGILRRAERRGKDLPKLLKQVLLMQSGSGGGCDGGGKGALVQEDKSGTLGTGNDQTIFCLATQQGGAELRSDDRAPTLTAAAGMSGNNQPVVCAGFEATPINLMVATHGKALGRGTGFGVGQPGDPANTISAAHSHGVFCAGFKAGQGAQAGGIGYGEEVSPTLAAAPSGTNQTPAVVTVEECDLYNAKLTGDVAATMTSGMAKGGSNTGPTVMCLNDQGGNVMGVSHDVSGTLRAQEHGRQPAVMAFAQNQREEVRNVGDKAVALAAEVGMHCQTFVVLDMSHACDVIRDCGEIAPSLQARMGTGGNQVPLTYGIGNGQSNEASVMAEEVSQALNTMHDAQAILYQPKSAMEENWAESETKNALRAGESKVSHVVVCEDVSPALRAKANDPYREDMAAYIASVDCRNFREGGETNGTLQAKSNGGTSYNLQNTVRTGMIVRRLTPMECERLQGFPDGWTDIGEWRDSKGKLRKPSDSPRYKALGNSIALPFWDFLAKRISAQYLRPVTMGSLFDGIGGFPLVFERHNGKGTARWASEIEEFPIAVTKKWFGEE